MADKTHIEWTDATWQPIVGCSVVSPGCTNCYAMRLAGSRLRHHPSRSGLTSSSKAGPVWNGTVRFIEEWLDQPLRWRRPRHIFVCAHGDLFHENVPDEWIDRVFAVMALCPQHVFQVLTKRPQRMRAYLSNARAHPVGLAALEQTLRSVAENPRSKVGHGVVLQGDIAHLSIWPLPNVWLGVSVEDQPRAEERVPHLIATPAALRFISAEPLLGAVDIRRWMNDWGCEACGYGGDQTADHCPNCGWKGDVEEEFSPCPDCGEELTDYYACPECGATNEIGFGPTLSGYTLGYIDWVIAGGESGPNARPMHPEWVRSLRDQCQAAGVPFFFKQWGEWAPVPTRDDLPGRPQFVRSGDCLVAPDGDRDEVEIDLSSRLEATGTPMRRVGKKAAGALLDGREWREFPR